MAPSASFRRLRPDVAAVVIGLCLVALQSHATSASGLCGAAESLAADSTACLLQKGLVGDLVASMAGPSPPLQSESSASDSGERLLFLIRTGGQKSHARMLAVNSTWASELQPEEIWLMQPDADCEKWFGNNHGKGLSCLEAKSEMAIARSGRHFDWLVVVDDDVYVQVPHLRKKLGSMSLSANATYGVPGCGNCSGYGETGFCGGGGYVVSHQNLMTMLGCDHGCGADASNASTCSLDCVEDGRYLERFLGGNDAEWCDVRFGCVASLAGLKPQALEGLYPWPFNSKEEEDSAVTHSLLPFLTLHYVQPEHMAHVHKLAHEGMKEAALLEGGSKSSAEELNRLRATVADMVTRLVHARQRESRRE